MTAARPWWVYTRVSTDDQAREGVSLDVQREACLGSLRSLGLPIGEVVVDPGYSAKSLDRPGMARVLGEVDAGRIAGVIVYKLDRLTRSLRDLIELMPRLESNGVALWSVQEKLDTASPMGRFFLHLIGAIAQWERETIAGRVQAGMDHRKAAGGYLGGRPPAGCRVEGPAGGRVLLRDERWAPVVEQAWARILAGGSLRDVAGDFARAGLPSKTAAGWTTAGVRKLLANQRAVGVLVSREDYDRVLAQLATRWSPNTRTGEQRHSEESVRVWPLSGIARCGRCESLLIGVHARNASGRQFAYLRCSGRTRRGRAFCAAKDLPAEPWEATVLAALVETVRKDQTGLVDALVELERASLASAAPLNARRRELELERDGLDRKLANLAELAAEGAAIARGLGAKIAEIQTASEALSIEIGRVDGQLAAYSIAGQGAHALVEALRTDLIGIEDAPVEEQARTLRNVLASAKLTPAEKVGNLDRVDLLIALPRFVHQRPMVEHRTLPTNSAAVAVSCSRRVPSRAELRG